MKHILFLVLLFGFCSQPAFSQLYPTKYRPPNLNWKQLETPHFNVVFPKGEDSVAYRTARILEHEYPKVQNLVGGELTNFPVVLNNFNDRSNGFVSSFHFRSEIEIPSIKGKAMNPQSGNWLETVTPHELVHALHYSHLNGIWANVIKLFSPDAARSINGGPPQGVHEGIAVYHETQNIAPDGGRGHYPYFTNQFEAVYDSPDRWSLGQMLGTSSYSRPFDRHYIGGYEFTNFLQQTYGDSTTNQVIDFFIRWPFLGYGTALRHVTGKWPGQLHNEFVEEHQKGVKDKSDSYKPLSIPYDGAEVRRPVWLSENRLLMYGSFYNASPGFYSYSLTEGRLEKALETRTVQDYNYDLSADRSRLLFANYRSSPYYSNTYKMELYEADLSTESTKRLSDNLRVFAPVYRYNGYYALQTDHESSTLIRLNPGSTSLSVVEKISLPNTEFVSVKLNPVDTKQLAIVANRRGLQGLWLVREDSIRQEIRRTPDISFNSGSIFDPAWHPSGDRLMFSSDHSGTMQLYEYDAKQQALTQLTNTNYNAMEGSYSPGGDRIAFIIQHQNEHLPVVLESSELLDQPVDSDLWTPSKKKAEFMTRRELGADLKEESDTWNIKPYRSNGQWILPRMVSPVISEVSNSGTYELGLTLSSNDLLQRNSYQLDLSYVQNRAWYDLSYHHAGFFPGFELEAFSRPRFQALPVQTPSGEEQSLEFLRQDAGASVGIPTRFILEDNVRQTVVGITPTLKLRGTRFFELDHNGDPASNYANFFTTNVYGFFRYRLQRNIRDLQPKSGVILFSELEHFFTSGATTIRTENYQVDIDFSRATAWRSGLYWYTAPLRRWNQSLRIGLEGLTQNAPTFDNQQLVSGGFSERIFPTSQHMLSFSTRYTVPLFYPDRGGFLIPAYLSSFYLVGFSNTVADLDGAGINNFSSASRTVFGLGLRTQFRISNVSFNIGIGLGYEPTRGKLNPFVGNF
ncbi:hypothetical protein NC796_09280 [Aliifodinibius sp. S!AR15-10]|uniref:hypothetical protein n=1 Tax=Aliifodinibius sp. S!AR15-10 TaxID=2950437 RepID=UPI00285EE7CB|nr:hypothetical protein [Aliifodinibius sp. S!AR15-10]MDR8391328.1 hypothetical protein [Aliifodinibius sp. S!AR15-10]